MCCSECIEICSLQIYAITRDANFKSTDTQDDILKLVMAAGSSGCYPLTQILSIVSTSGARNGDFGGPT